MTDMTGASLNSVLDILIDKIDSSVDSIYIKEFVRSLALNEYRFKFCLKGLQKGVGYGVDGFGLLPPASFEEASVEDPTFVQDWKFVLSFDNFDGTDYDVFLSEDQFVFYMTIAIVFHAKYVNKNLDAWEEIRSIKKTCSREFQSKLVEEFRELIKRRGQ